VDLTYLAKEPHPDGPVPVDLGPVDELLANDRAVVEVYGEPVLVLRVRKRIVAVNNRCPHLGRRLDDGVVHRNRLRCQGHGRTYKLASDRCETRHGSPTSLQMYAAWISDGHVFVRGEE
jgi:3-phenylpropionate/trans-cinnamate dioxygenase ferredoxin component